jgi:hypothetical protein
VCYVVERETFATDKLQIRCVSEYRSSLKMATVCGRNMHVSKFSLYMPEQALGDPEG